MYKCPGCKQDLFITSYVHKEYGCLNFNCFKNTIGIRYSQDYCEKYLQPEVINVKKEVLVTSLFDGEMFEVNFIMQPRRGYFKEHIEPIVLIIKSMVPATQREYDPNTKNWTIAAVYWVPLEITLKGLGWTVTSRVPKATSDPKVHVPEDYAENFYRAPSSEASASTENVAEKLSQLLQIADVSKFDAYDLKKIYRIKARKYHPDLGGDAAKMAELNRLWSLYNAS